MPDPRRPRAGHRFNREPAAAAEPLGTPSRRAAIRLLDAVLRLRPVMMVRLKLNQSSMLSLLLLASRK